MACHFMIQLWKGCLRSLAALAGRNQLKGGHGGDVVDSIVNDITDLEPVGRIFLMKNEIPWHKKLYCNTCNQAENLLW